MNSCEKTTMNTLRTMTVVAGLVLCVLGAPLFGAAGRAKVFILAGQSNMEGKAQNALLDHQATDVKTKDLFKHLRKDGKWIVRDDVFIKFLNRKGLGVPKLPFAMAADEKARGQMQHCGSFWCEHDR